MMLQALVRNNDDADQSVAKRRRVAKAPPAAAAAAVDGGAAGVTWEGLQYESGKYTRVFQPRVSSGCSLTDCL